MKFETAGKSIVPAGGARSQRQRVTMEEEIRGRGRRQIVQDQHVEKRRHLERQSLPGSRLAGEDRETRETTK